ncbi:MAG: hypothetical protein V1824_01505 [archaeon]
MIMQNLSELSCITGKNLKLILGIKNPEVYLSRYLLNKKINKIEKGKYTTQDNVLTYCTQIISPSYLSFHSALYYYGFTTQLPLKETVAIRFIKKELENIKFIRIGSKSFFGYERIKYNGYDLFIATREKLLIDCVQYQNQSIQINELLDLLKSNLNKEMIISYLKRINNLNLIKRIGYLLSLINIDIYADFKSKIENNRKYILLNKNNSKTKKFNIKWKININEDLNYDN